MNVSLPLVKPNLMGDDLTSINQLDSLKGCKFVYLNIRSLSANLNVFKADIENGHNNLIAIGLCETWLNDKLHDELLCIEGFNLYRYDRRLKKRGGGLAIYVDDKYKVDTVSDIYNVSNSDIELFSLIINMPKQKNFIFTVVYIPPNANHTKALEEIEKCSVLYKEGKSHWIIGGDFNLDYAGKGSRVSEKKALINFEQRNNMHQVIKNPTRTTSKAQSLIDLIFTSANEIVTHAGTICYNISDHDMIYAVFKKKVMTDIKPDMIFKCRNMKNYKVAQLLHKLTSLDWTPLYQNRNSTECWKIIYTNYLTSLNEIAPFIQIKGNSNKEEWVDNACLNKLQKRDRLRQELNYNIKDEDLNINIKKHGTKPDSILIMLNIIM